MAPDRFISPPTPSCLTGWWAPRCGLKFFLMGQWASTFSRGLEMLLYLSEPQFRGSLSFRISGTPLLTCPLLHCPLGSPPPPHHLSNFLCWACISQLMSSTLTTTLFSEIPQFHHLFLDLSIIAFCSAHTLCSPLLPLVLSLQWVFSKLFFTSLFWVSMYSIVRWESITSGCLTGRKGVGGETNATMLWVVGFMNSDILWTSSMVGWPVFFPVFSAPWKERY